MATVSATRTRRVVYPTSDGKPMAETDLHRKLMTRLIQILERWFGDKPMIYVSGNLLIYYEPGNKRKHVAPDVFVVIGVQKKDREYYLTWEEGKFPTVVIEVTSSSTRSDDIKKKFILYRDVFQVKEYFLFDPRSDYLKPRLRGFRLAKGEYVPMALVDGRLMSKQLGLYLQEDGAVLQLIDPATGQALLSPDEQVALAEQQLHHKDAEIERLRQELGRCRGS
jgi:Uma2 family endonuclease